MPEEGAFDPISTSRLPRTAPKMPIRTNVMGMPPTASGPAGMSDETSNWVNVAWMPHSCLSQTSHLCLSVRSVLTLMEQHCKIEEWQVRVTIHGAAGLSLVPVATTTSTAPRLLIKDFWQSHENGMFDKDAEWLPLVSSASHICKFDSVIHIPIRWRDLPRDAYLLFEVLGYCDKVVSSCVCFVEVDSGGNDPLILLVSI